MGTTLIFVGLEMCDESWTLFDLIGLVGRPSGSRK